MANQDAVKILNGVEVNIKDFPKDIRLKPFEADGENTITMVLCAEAAGLGTGDAINMQDDAAAFEAWALIIEAKALTENIRLKVMLDVDEISATDYNAEKPLNGCFGRFLYRILKFSEQYKEWFALSPKLNDFKNKFIEYLKKGHKFKNNIPNGESETDENKLWNKGLEKYVEWKLCTKDDLKESILHIDKKTVIDRQLPVGLFEDEVKRDNTVFTGGTSAIDFWALDNEKRLLMSMNLKQKIIWLAF